MVASFLAALCAVTYQSPGADKGQVSPSRVEFARALSKIQPGLTEDGVRTILGPPDGTMKEHEVVTSRVTSTWKYGSYRGMPTLGCVHFDAKGFVLSVEPTDGNVDRNLPPEETLRPILFAMHSSCAGRPWYETPYEFQGLPLISVAQKLIDLGPEKGEATLKEFLRISPSTESPELHCLFRLVFRPEQKSYDYPPLIRARRAPTEFDGIATYPFLVDGDIPYLLETLGESRLDFLSPATDLDQLILRCSYRREPLAPTNRPWQVLLSVAIFKASSLGNDSEPILESQVLNEMALVGYDTSYDGSAKSWQDKSPLPNGWTELAPTLFSESHPQQVWWPKVFGGYAHVALQRINVSYVQIRFVVQEQFQSFPWNEIRCSTSESNKVVTINVSENEGSIVSGQRIIQRTVRLSKTGTMTLNLGNRIFEKFDRQESWTAAAI